MQTRSIHHNPLEIEPIIKKENSSSSQPITTCSFINKRAIQIRNSTHGKGLFATELIPKGSYIGIYGGNILSPTDARSLTKDSNMSYTHAQYQFTVTKSYLVEAYNHTFMSQPAEALNQGPLATMLEKSRIGIEGFVEQFPSPLAFANTSLDTSLNNAYFYSTKTNSTHSIHPIRHRQCMRNVIILVTQQDIKPNEEILADYGPEYRDKLLTEISEQRKSLQKDDCCIVNVHRYLGGRIDLSQEIKKECDDSRDPTDTAAAFSKTSPSKRKQPATKPKKDTKIRTKVPRSESPNKRSASEAFRPDVTESPTLTTDSYKPANKKSRPSRGGASASSLSEPEASHTVAVTSSSIEPSKKSSKRKTEQLPHRQTTAKRTKINSVLPEKIVNFFSKKGVSKDTLNTWKKESISHLTQGDNFEILLAIAGSNDSLIGYVSNKTTDDLKKYIEQWKNLDKKLDTDWKKKLPITIKHALYDVFRDSNNLQTALKNCFTFLKKSNKESIYGEKKATSVVQTKEHIEQHILPAIEKLTNKNINLDKISKLGAQSLLALHNSWDSLTAKGLSKDDLVKICSNNGTKQALEYLESHWGSLSAKGFTKDGLVTKASNEGSTGLLNLLS